VQGKKEDVGLASQAAGSGGGKKRGTAPLHQTTKSYTLRRKGKANHPPEKKKKRGVLKEDA